MRISSSLMLIFLWGISINLSHAKSSDWLTTLPSGEQMEKVAKHLRGFDMTMMEVGMRYTELFWAGMDENWENASYQLGKIEKTIKLGIERRPKRAGNAKIFLASLNKLKSSLKKKNISDFKEQFLQLRESCNKCHASEKVSFFKVKTPKVRILPF